MDMNVRDKKERVIQRNKRGGECTERKSKGSEGGRRRECEGRGGWGMYEQRKRVTTAATSRQQ